MIIILFTFVFVLVVLQSWIWLFKDSRKTNATGPFPLPILGNAHLFFGDPTHLLDVFGRLADKYNDACRFYLFSTRYMVLSHPKYLEPLLMSSTLINKGGIYNLAKDWIGGGIVTSLGASWKRQRRLLAPTFQTSILQSFMPVFTKNNTIFKEHLTTLADGRNINLPVEVKKLTFDNVMESIIGISFAEQTEKAAKYLRSCETVTQILIKRIGNPLLANDLVFDLLPYKGKWDKAVENIRNSSKEVIKARRKELMGSKIASINTNSESGPSKRLSFLDLLLLTEVNGEQLDDEEVLAQVNTFMFAGHDTLATSSMFTMYCLSKHKAVQDKLVEEQKRVLNGEIDRDPTFIELSEMKYLEAVIKEAMRIYPPAPLVQRLITQDVDLGGIHVPKDTLIFVNFFQMHRNPKVFEDPLEFRPERFEKSLDSPVSWAPFSAGPRNCIGLKFAMIELKMIFSSIVRHFELSPSGIEPEIICETTLNSKNGVHVKVFPRS